MKYLVILMIFLLLTSFKLENENNKSTIYIIRPSVVGFAVKLKITENNREVGHLKANSYIKIDVNSGLTTIKNNFDKNKKLELDVKPNQIYYIINNIQPSLFNKKSEFILLSKEDGEKLLEKISK